MPLPPFILCPLLQEQLPDLWTHFQGLNLEAHMYASQWFLTLFTAKFPLCMVFHITDLLLCEVHQEALTYTQTIGSGWGHVILSSLSLLSI